MPAGRPTVMTPETLAKLREAFLWGCSDPEACLYADIDSSTLYRYQRENANYSSEKRVWQSSPVLRARRSVVEALDSDPHLALKYLERKLPAEFNPRRDEQRDDKESKRASIIDLVREISENRKTLPEPLPPEVPRAGLTVDMIRALTGK